MVSPTWTRRRLIDAIIATLEEPAPGPGLTRSPQVDDVDALPSTARDRMFAFSIDSANLDAYRAETYVRARHTVRLVFLASLKAHGATAQEKSERSAEGILDAVRHALVSNATHLPGVRVAWVRTPPKTRVNDLWRCETVITIDADEQL